MAGKHALRGAGVLTMACLCAGLWPALAGAEDTVAFTISDPRVTAASGLARDTGAGLYWTADDSGRQGRAYALTPAGKVEGTFEFRVEPTDVEAVALQGERLYVADIGDQDRERREVTVFYFDGPRPNGSTVTYKSWDFRYDTGKHDAETLLVGATGQMLVVTKAAEGAVYAAPKTPKTIGTNTLTKVGKAPAMVTDGVFLPGDTQIALLTATEVQVIDAETYAKVASAPVPDPEQAASLTLSLDGTSLLVGSKGPDTKVYEMAIPGAASATPTPAPDSGDTQPDEPEDPATTSGQSRRGTFLAIGLAGVVAVVAGVVVAFARKP